MNRRNFLSVLGPVGAMLAAPLSWLKSKPKAELIVMEGTSVGFVPIDWDKERKKIDLVVEQFFARFGYVIVEDAGTFGNLTNGYRFRLAVREVMEGCWSEPVCGIRHLEGRFLCDPPRNYKGENVEMDAFEISSPSLTCLLRTFRDGSFKSNGPYRLSAELAEELREAREGYRMCVTQGMTPNEVRALRGRPPITSRDIVSAEWVGEPMPLNVKKKSYKEWWKAVTGE